jgi:hypothetical protein
MDQSHQQLLRAVCSHFMSTAEWPETGPLQIKLRKLGNIGKLAVEIGSDKIHCDRNSQAGNCKLTLLGISQCEEAADELQRFLRTVRGFAQAYISEGAPSQIRLSQFVTDQELSSLELRRLAELIRIAPSLWRGLTTDKSGNLTLTPDQNLFYFEDVQTLDDFYAAHQRAREDEIAANQIRVPGYTIPIRELPAKARTVRQDRPDHEYVSHSRINELTAIKHPDFDLRRLIALCEELNRCAESECVFATAMLTRAIIDHVPPIFGLGTFAQVASNYAGSKSFKASVQHLEKSARYIADGHLHGQIRRKEVLPTWTQVDFSRDLDVLLSEIVRILP